MAFQSTTAANNAVGSYRHVAVSPVAGSLGAEISGIDVRSMDDDVFAEVRRASLDHLVVFFRDQDLTEVELEEFTLRWGTFGENPFIGAMQDHPNIVRVLKAADERVPAVFGGVWHSDWSFLERPPSHTILYAIDIPPYGGDTLWSNMYLAYDWCSSRMDGDFDSMVAIHSPEAGYGPQALHNEFLENIDVGYGDDEGWVRRAQPLVRVHPETGRRALNVSPGYVVGIEGMDPDVAASLLEDLLEVATHPAFQCRFRWAAGSLAAMNC